MQNGDWSRAFVLSKVKNLYFFVIIDKGFSAILNDPREPVQVGGFFEVIYIKNDNAKEDQRAQHTITQYRPIEPLADVELDLDRRNQTHVIMTTTARYDGLLEGNIVTLYNREFGNFVDMDRLIAVRNKLVVFQFRCKASPVNNYLSIFVPVRVIAYHDMPPQDDPRFRRDPECRTVVGFVCSGFKNGYQYVFSKQLDKDVHLYENECPSYQDMTGKWIEMDIDMEEFRIIRPVREVEPIFPTRIMLEVPEIFVEFEYDGFYETDNFFVFRDSGYFGLISDSFKTMRDVDRNGQYSGWIVRQNTSIPNCNWAISPKQDLLVPANLHREPNRYENRSASPHSTSGQFPGTSTRRSDPYDPPRSRNSSSISNRARSNVVEEDDELRSPTPLSRAPTTDDDSDAGSPEEKTHMERKSPDDVAPGNRRNNSSSSAGGDSHLRGTVEFSSSDDDSDDSDDSDNEASNNSNKLSSYSWPMPPILQRPAVSGLSTPSRNGRMDANSTYATPLSHITSPEQTRNEAGSTTPQKSESERENRKDKLKLLRISELVRKFMSNAKILEDMKLVDLEESEELANLVSS
ncbi:DUF4210 domain-containing protein [Caenorhabditis elegans]|uniref:DUF4210 domain-containing protein n=1 Tax=Caenorhabditis elegans TaxID=6239 RepID=A7LPH1_CAEEL|nr:DUF4210 domain-containing protein [Caenorhabditis elegans]CAO82013.1 DUF4210 domain-containing protein [Caenorhabditis elegans]|eukprot:NP_001122753.1 Uncharacterized protein CELE_B0001.3 [Caenorhabditis elegans]